MSARDAFTVVVLRNNGHERLMLSRSPDALPPLERADMIPNPVQRRRVERPTDSMIEPCAQEGGTFRDPVPARDLPIAIPEYSLPSWLAALIIVATCAACAWIGA